VRAKACAIVVALLLAACSSQTPRERLAQRVTVALASGDFSGVQSLFAPTAATTRVEIAEDADELAAQGALKSVREETSCDPGWHCFRAIFERGALTEHARLNGEGRIVGWYL